MQRNAIILAAGTASRFVPLSQEYPKGLLEVNGEILIERQIRQLQEAGVSEICIVVGYKAEMFEYLKEKFRVELVYNDDYARYNNTSSMMRVLDRLEDTFICSSDNYFPSNVFKGDPLQSYYSSLYAEGDTSEYCIRTDEKDCIKGVDIGGRDSWYMVGHVYFSKDFSDCFKVLLKKEYNHTGTRLGYWEDVYIRNIGNLPLMRINRYKDDEIKEFDTLDELRKFDRSYIDDTRSMTIKNIARRLGCRESEMTGFSKISNYGNNVKFSFRYNEDMFVYDSDADILTKT